MVEVPVGGEVVEKLGGRGCGHDPLVCVEALERGGDQLAHSIWAFATGGPVGSGPGMGDPGMIPAGHTDLVLSAIGEEWGFAGVACVLLLFAFLFWRAMRAATERK